MELTKIIRQKQDAPLADLPFGLRIHARAWTEGTTINVVEGNDQKRILLAHEAAHAIRDQDNAQMHHPWWHFCGLVGHALRLMPRSGITGCAALSSRELIAGNHLASVDSGFPVRVS